MKSRLPTENLSQIWWVAIPEHMNKSDCADRELADTQHRGALDAQAFTIAMYLIQGCMAGTITSVPHSLPPSLYSQAALTMSQPDFDSLYMSGPSSSGSTWAVPADVRSSADAFFDAFDERRNGYLDREIIQAHLRQTGLPEETVQRIWWAGHNRRFQRVVTDYTQGISRMRIPMVGSLETNSLRRSTWLS